jgi:hypothetical protein
MATNNPLSVLMLEVSASEAVPDERIDEQVVQLGHEIRELNIESVERLSTGKDSRGAKCAETLTVGGLVVVLVPDLIKELIRLVFDWIQRNPGRTIKIRQKEGGPEYEITGAWKAEQLAEVMKVFAKTDSSNKAG